VDDSDHDADHDDESHDRREHRLQRASAVTLYPLGPAAALLCIGCAVAGPIPMALGQSETLTCEGSARVSSDGALTCEGELRWVTGGPLSTGFAAAIGGARETALRAVGAAVGVPAP
jgi:hypothetical protein